MINTEKIAHRFYLISFSLFLVVTIICAAFFFYDNSVVKKRIEESLISENQRILSKFDDSLSYTKHLMRYIGGQIQRNNAQKDYEFINQLLMSYRIPSNDIMTWSTFSWVDKNFRLVISSNEGINLANSVDMSKRDYIPRTVSNPEMLQCGAPVFGVKSGLWSIPMGYGIVDKKGNYIGAIVTGMVIDGVKKKLDEAIRSNKILFALIDTTNSTVITKSDGLPQSAMKNVFKEVGEGQEFISRSEHFYYKKLPNYHYAVVTFYLDKGGFHNRWITYPFLVLLVVFLVGFPLILFEKKLVIPIKKLAKIARDISLNKEPKFIGVSSIEEIDDLTKQLKNIQQYKTDLLKAKNSQSNFFLNMSHELRTPLTGVISFAELMKKESYGALQKEYLFISNQIYNSGKHLLSLIDNLLNFSRIKSGKIKLQKENLRVVEEVKEAINKISAEAVKKGIKVRLIYDSEEVVVRADRHMFQSVILNLLSNAIKFSHEKGEIKIFTEVRVNGELEIKVSDEGIGIKKSDIPIILEEYGQAQDGYKTHSHKGTGLGLPIVQKIVSSHGGRIEIKSIYGKGTDVIITLPKGEKNSYIDFEI